MRTPASLLSLVDEGIVDEVVRPLMSGKEAQVYLVRSSGALCVAKVYKEAQHRSFKQRAEYTEGRNVRNSRDQRAMGKRTQHGREKDEAAWRTAEVDMIYRLRSAGVRVPHPHHFVDGVLIMELVTDAHGEPAPRLGDVDLDRDTAFKVFDRLIGEVVRMLSAGVVHGDLSDFNVLMGADGPVVIDFPQSVNAAGNQSARKLLLRDVDNLHDFITRFIPGWQRPPLAQEMWQLYERGELTAETRLTGTYKAPRNEARTGEVLSLIADANHDELRRRQQHGIRKRGGPNAAQARPMPPANNARPPVNNARPPVNNARPPVNNARPPVNNARPPANNARPPVNNARPPANNARPPVNNARPPVNNAQANVQANGDAPPRRRSRNRRRRNNAARGQTNNGAG